MSKRNFRKSLLIFEFSFSKNLNLLASIATYHPHHPNPHARNHPSYSSAQPLSANYPLNAKYVLFYFYFLFEYTHF